MRSILIAALAAVSLTAAAPPRVVPRAPAAKVSDAELERRIKARFARSKISVNKFEVTVQGGIATIDGKTGVIQHKGTATRLAKAAGASQVVNRVAVSEEAKRKAAEKLEIRRKRGEVKRAKVVPGG